MHTNSNVTSTESEDKGSTSSTQEKGANLHRFNSLYDPKLAVHDLDTMVVNPEIFFEL